MTIITGAQTNRRKVLARFLIKYYKHFKNYKPLSLIKYTDSLMNINYIKS